jgi:hypothetical protein
MQPSATTWPGIQAHIDRIRASYRVRHLTNWFSAPTTGPWFSLASEQAVLFGSSEEGFWRLYYFAAAVEPLAPLLREWPRQAASVIGYVDRHRHENLCAAFQNASFGEKSTYQRMTNPRLPLRKGPSSPEFARPDETESLHRLLRETFEPMTDHLPQPHRLAVMVAQQQAIVCRTNGQLTGALLFQPTGQQVNFNFLVNRGGGNLDLLTLTTRFYQLMHQRQIRSGFLWVDSRNTGVIQLHQTFGWNFDGLKDWFFVRSAA